MGMLLPALLSGTATVEEKQLFGELWQDRVCRILIDHHDDPRLVLIR
jgi:hypothetical protein